MKTTTRTIELTLEKKERTFVRRSAKNTQARCGVCGDESGMPVATDIEYDRSDILGPIGEGNVGIRESQDGSSLVCLNCIEKL